MELVARSLARVPGVRNADLLELLNASSVLHTANHADAAHMRVFTFVDDGRRESTRVGEPPVTDLWDGYRPEVALALDARNGVLRTAEVTATKPKLEPARVFPRELRERLVGDLRSHDVVVEEDFDVHRGAGRARSARSNGIEGIFGNAANSATARAKRTARELETGENRPI